MHIRMDDLWATIEPRSDFIAFIAQVCVCFYSLLEDNSGRSIRKFPSATFRSVWGERERMLRAKVSKSERNVSWHSANRIVVLQNVAILDRLLRVMREEFARPRGNFELGSVFSQFLLFSSCQTPKHGLIFFLSFFFLFFFFVHTVIGLYSLCHMNRRLSPNCKLFGTILLFFTTFTHMHWWWNDFEIQATSWLDFYSMLWILTMAIVNWIDCWSGVREVVRSYTRDVNPIPIQKYFGWEQSEFDGEELGPILTIRVDNSRMRFWIVHFEFLKIILHAILPSERWESACLRC